MGLIKRFSRTHQARPGRSAGHLQDPGAAFDLVHERQFRALQQLRTSAAQLVATGKRLEVQVLNLRLRRGGLDAQARRSLADGREAEAVAALTHAQELDAQIADLEGRVAQLAELRQHLETNGRRLEARVLSSRTQAETMRAQYGAAKAAVAAGEALAGLAPEDTELESLVQQAQDKIAWTQARADAVGGLLQGGTLRPPGTSGADAWGEQVAEVNLAGRVQERLAELRADVSRQPPPGLEAPAAEPPVL